MGPFSFRPFGSTRSQKDAEALYATIVALARRPSLYGPGRVADTFDGRFETLVVHAALAMWRLKAEPTAERLAQDFTDRLFQGLDESLREAGVGDLSVSKHMKGLAKRVYGRVAAYEEALQQGETAMAEALVRNVWNGLDAAGARPLAAWVGGAHAVLAAAPLAGVIDGTAWPQFGE